MAFNTFLNKKNTICSSSLLVKITHKTITKHIQTLVLGDSPNMRPQTSNRSFCGEADRTRVPNRFRTTVSLVRSVSKVQDPSDSSVGTWHMQVRYHRSQEASIQRAEGSRFVDFCSCDPFCRVLHCLSQRFMGLRLIFSDFNKHSSHEFVEQLEEPSHFFHILVVQSIEHTEAISPKRVRAARPVKEAHEPEPDGPPPSPPCLR